MVTLLGFAALSVDLGYLYMVRAELQVAADAAALAAAGQLANGGGDAQAAARQMANQYAAINPVLNQTPVLDPATDVVFGQAILNPATGKYDFVPNAAVTDAVRVRVRRTADSPNGSVPLLFANIFGKSQKDMFAESTAILVPRDIAIVADLSASHNDDSELRHINEPNISINLWNVWAAMPGGMSPSDPNYSPQKAGPTWGAFMQQAGFGEMTLNSGYNPVSDTGLAYLPKGSSWTSNTVIANLLRAQNYNEREVSAILSASYDSDETVWKARVCTALGLSVWRSGLGADPDGKLPKWQIEGLTPGNGDTKVVWSSELTWVRSYPYPSGSWSDWLTYVKSTSSRMYSEGNTAFRYRFGVKTFMNYLLENKPSHSACPDLALTPAQPMQAVKEAVERMMQIIDELDTDDQVSLEVYDTWGRHEVDLTKDYAQISHRLNQMQAGYYQSTTNMADGENKAIAELSSGRARLAAVKVMILLTDGNANTDLSGYTGYDEYEPDTLPKIQAREKAQEAAAMGIRIYTVGVGARVDTVGLEEIAAIGHGTYFQASGSIDDYTAQLRAIFETLGGKRPVMLIN